jgi:hypothetical protein
MKLPLVSASILAYTLLAVIWICYVAPVAVP